MCRLRIRGMARYRLTRKRKKGPALVLDYGSTTLIPAGWQFVLDKTGNLVARAFLPL